MVLSRLNKKRLKEFKNGFVLSLQMILGVVFMVTLFQIGNSAYEASIVNHIDRSVVKITLVTNTNAGGTGFMMETSRGQVIITNAHICRHLVNGMGFVFSPGKEEPRLSHVIAISETADLCAMTPVVGVPSLSLGSRPTNKDRLSVIGHPYLQPRTLSSGNLVTETFIPVIDELNECHTNKLEKSGNLIEVEGECYRAYNGYLTTIVIYPGNSGSPVFNVYGNVVGVAFASNSIDHKACVVTFDDLVSFLSELDQLKEQI